MALLEVACFSPESAVTAYEAGADRIELCDDREAGGTTPPLTWLVNVKQQVMIPVYVMIRPRGGDFQYAEEEFSQMKSEVNGFKLHADGYVFGILDADHKVDVARTAELVRLASPLPCTFHKAFDESPVAIDALEDIVTTGCSTILTAGCAISAHAGLQTLGHLVRISQGRVTVMPGGGVRSSNIAAIQAYTGASIFHSSAAPEGNAGRPDPAEIRQIKALLQDGRANPPPTLPSLSPNRTKPHDDDDTISETQRSAVSIGTTPVEYRKYTF